MDAGAGFWIFIAAVVIADMWKGSRQKTEEHETLRRIVEKTGTIDEARLKELFTGRPSAESQPGFGYRAARVAGTITLFIGAAIATFIVVAAGIAKFFGTQMIDDPAGLTGMLGVSAGIAMLGLGIFLSSRFCEPPPSITRGEPPTH